MHDRDQELEAIENVYDSWDKLSHGQPWNFENAIDSVDAGSFTREAFAQFESEISRAERCVTCGRYGWELIDDGEDEVCYFCSGKHQNLALWQHALLGESDSKAVVR